MSGGRKRVASNDALPPKEESSSQNGLVVLNIEALVREAFGIMKAKIDEEERSDMWWDSETSEDGQGSIVGTCTIGDEGEEIPTDNDVQNEVVMDKSSVIDGADFSTGSRDFGGCAHVRT